MGGVLSVYRAYVFVVPFSFANPTCIKLLRERLTLSSLIHLTMTDSDQDQAANPPPGVTLDKGVVKEALYELLNEILVFRQFLATSTTSASPRSWNLATQVTHLLDQVRWGHHAQAFVKNRNSYFDTSQLLLGIYSGINV